jgi:hypothetical protein
MLSETNAKVVVLDVKISKMIKCQELPIALWTTPIINADLRLDLYEQKVG